MENRVTFPESESKFRYRCGLPCVFGRDVVRCRTYSRNYIRYTHTWLARERKPGSRGASRNADEVFVAHILTFKGFLYLMLHTCVFQILHNRLLMIAYFV